MSFDERWVNQNFPRYRGEHLLAQIKFSQSQPVENRGARLLTGAFMDELIDNHFFNKSDINRRVLAEALGVKEGVLVASLWSWNKQKMEFAEFIKEEFQDEHNRPFPGLVSADASLGPEAKAFIRDIKLPDCAGGSIHALRPFWPRWKCFAEEGGCLLPVDWDSLACLLFPQNGPYTKAINRCPRPAWSGACRQPPGSTPGPQRSSLESAAAAAPVTRAPELVTQAGALGSSSGGGSSSSESDEDERAVAATKGLPLSTRARAARCIGAREHAPRPKRICCCIAAAALTVERHSGDSPLLPESGCRRRPSPPPVFLP